MQDFDIIIVGAGINGCALAHALHDKGKRVLVLDKEGIAAGGSGAAGAFINPKISKAGPLKELIEDAYRFSLEFYIKHVPHLCTPAPLLHIAKYADDNDKVSYFKSHTSLNQMSVPSSVQGLLTEHAKAFASVCLKENAVLEAQQVCEALLEGVPYVKQEVKNPCYQNGQWYIDSYRSPVMVLTTGAYESVIKDESIQLRRIYGQRCEVESPQVLDMTMHHEVSVSATKKNGRIAIGASHYLHEEQMPSLQEESETLMEMAKKSFKLEEIRLRDSFRGMRSGSNDYLPIVGQMIDIDKSLALAPQALKGDKTAPVCYKDGLYIINGVGGYGFVLAPYLASMLAEHLISGKEIEAYLQPKRFYYRYAKNRGKQQ